MTKHDDILRAFCIYF